VYSEAGFDIPSLIHQKNQTRHLSGVYCRGSVCTIVPHDVVTNRELLELDVDVLVPAATENQITEENVDRVQARTIIEMANGPINSLADRRLAQRQILVIPDILANAGGVTVSYFEWVQNKSGLYWTEQEIHQRLKQVMSEEFSAVYDRMTSGELDMRTAAYAHALNRLGRAIEAHGTRDYFRRNG